MEHPEKKPGENVTELLHAWSEGDSRALGQLTEIVHAELRRIARRYMQRERPGHSLQATALVNEAYLRLVDYNRIGWKDRSHFFAVSATLMRRILVDYARSRNLKRGAGFVHVTLENGLPGARQQDSRRIDLLAVSNALDSLARLDPRKAQVVELRFFGGLNVEETAEALGISVVTVMRDWSTARAWLLREMSREAPNTR